MSSQEVKRSFQLQESIYKNCIYTDFEKGYRKYYDVKTVNCFWKKKPSIMLIFTDNTDRVQNEKLKEQDQYKNEMLASVCHDLKTPLNSMLGMLQASMSIEDLSKLKNINCLVLKNGFLFLHLISDILDYSQIIKNKLRLIFSVFKIDELINEIFDLFINMAQEKKIQLNKKIQINSYQSEIYSDCNRIKQILINLVGNALKFTAKGQISINVSDDNNQPHSLCICVEDTGTGIADNIKPKLFQLFETYDNQQGCNKNGIGLGLFICKKLVKQLGPLKKIIVDSELGRGSIFKFYIFKDMNNAFNNQKKQLSQQLTQRLINLHDRKNSEELSMDYQMNIENICPLKIMQINRRISHPKFNNTILNINENQGQTHISNNSTYKQIQNDKNQLQLLISQTINFLVVDDNAFNIISFKEMMSVINNIKIDEANNGQQAIDKLKQYNSEGHSFDVIFMDVNMPILDGIEATKIIKTKIEQQELLPTYIVALSAIDQEDKQRCIQAKVDDFLFKPFTYSQIYQVMLKFYSNIK